MRKKISLIMTAAVILAFATGVFAKSVYETVKVQMRPDFTVVIDGEKQVFKNADGERVYPVLYNGTTYLPIRAIGEIMKKTVYWYEDEKKIELKGEKNDNKATVTDADVIIQKDNNNGQNKSKPDKVGYISEESAKKIALDKAGLKESEVSFMRVEFDRDNGILKYEVEFRKGLKEYSTEIKADDGKILDWEVDISD